MESVSVVLVEDDRIIRSSLKKSIPWHSYGLNLVGEAENGEDGLQSIEKLCPDIVITGIKMPGMNGIELVNVLSERYPSIRKIIISGYDDFQYAQLAIKAGVDEYLLKPVLKADFVNVLNRLKHKVLKEKTDRKNQTLIMEKASLGNQYLRDKVMYDYIVEQKESASREVMAYFPESSPKNIAIALAEADGKASFAVESVREKIMAYDNGFNAFLAGNKIVGIVVRSENISRLNDLREFLKDQLKTAFTIGVGSVGNSVCHLHISFQEAEKALAESFYTGKDRIISVGEIEKKKKACDYPCSDEKQILNCIIENDTPSLSRSVKQFYDDILSAGRLERALVFDETIKLLTGIERGLINAEFIDSQSKNIEIMPYDEVFSMTTLHDLMELLIQRLKDLAKYFSFEKGVNNCLVRKAQLIIHEDCKNATLNSVSKKVAISPTYLSLLFTLVTNETFTDYATKVRLEKAKDLLKNTSSKLYEIADCVGYNDPRYFSQLFKKKTGLTPRQYRDGIAG